MAKPPSCEGCPLHSAPYVAPTGPTNARTLVIGEAPGEVETTLGRNFSGGSGKVLRSVMEDVGLTSGAISYLKVSYTRHAAVYDFDTAQAMFTNIVRCRPPANRDPTPEEIEHCAPLLNELLATSGAKVILTLGRLALQRFIGPEMFRTIQAKPMPQSLPRAAWDMYVYRFGHEIPKEISWGKKRGRYGPTIEKGKGKGLRRLETVDRRMEVGRPGMGSGSSKAVGCCVVSGIHPAAVARSGFKEITQLRAACSHAREILDGEQPYTGPRGECSSVHELVGRLTTHRHRESDDGAAIGRSAARSGRDEGDVGGGPSVGEGNREDTPGDSLRGGNSTSSLAATEGNVRTATMVQAIAFDIEMPHPYEHISRISFATPDVCGSFQWLPAVQKAAKEILEGDTGPELIAHNAAYDTSRLRRHAEIETSDTRIRCSMIAAMCDEPDLRKGLGFVAPRELLCVPWKHLDDEDPAKYNAMDSQVTAMIWEGLKPSLQHDGQWPFYVETLMPALRHLEELTNIGIAVDPVYREEWRIKLEEDLAATWVRWEDLTGGIKPGSYKKLGVLLYETLGMLSLFRGGKIPKRMLTDTGAPGTNEKCLNKLRAKLATAEAEKKVDVALCHEHIDLLLKVRGLKKSLATYNTELAVHDDGCVHPNYLPSGKDFDDALAASMRLASRNPNIQNQPQEARYLYVPHYSGWVMWARDFSQIEARLIAIVSNEQWMIDAFDAGEDLHQHTATMLAAEMGREVSRDEGKRYRHGFHYCMGPTQLSEFARIPYSTANRVIQAMRRLHPNVVRYQHEVAARAAADGHLSNAFGLLRRFPGFASYAEKLKHAANQAANFRPQSEVALIMWALLGPVVEGLQSICTFTTYPDTAKMPIDITGVGLHGAARLLTQAHDEFVGECNAATVNHTDIATRRVMERTWDMIAPGWSCPTTFSVGPTWAHCKIYEKRARANGCTPAEAWQEDGAPTWKGSG